MRYALILLVLLLLVSCGHKYENTDEQKAFFALRGNQKLDTIIATYVETTGSLDLYCPQGNLTFPEDLRLSEKLTGGDIKVCGNFPKDLIDASSWWFEPGLKFRIVGKIIAADTNNAVGRVPLFYVTDWQKLDKASRDD